MTRNFTGQSDPSSVKAWSEPLVRQQSMQLTSCHHRRVALSDGVLGVTSNPAIFEAEFAGGTADMWMRRGLSIDGEKPEVPSDAFADGQDWSLRRVGVWSAERRGSLAQ